MGEPGTDLDLMERVKGFMEDVGREMVVKTGKTMFAVE